MEFKSNVHFGFVEYLNFGSKGGIVLKIVDLIARLYGNMTCSGEQLDEDSLCLSASLTLA